VNGIAATLFIFFFIFIFIFIFSPPLSERDEDEDEEKDRRGGARALRHYSRFTDHHSHSRDGALSLSLLQFTS
jgi:hypothetical protein